MHIFSSNNSHYAYLFRIESVIHNFYLQNFASLDQALAIPLASSATKFQLMAYQKYLFNKRLRYPLNSSKFNYRNFLLIYTIKRYLEFPFNVIFYFFSLTSISLLIFLILMYRSLLNSSKLSKYKSYFLQYRCSLSRSQLLDIPILKSHNAKVVSTNDYQFGFFSRVSVFQDFLVHSNLICNVSNAQFFNFIKEYLSLNLNFASKILLLPIIYIKLIDVPFLFFSIAMQRSRCLIGTLIDNSNFVNPRPYLIVSGLNYLYMYFYSSNFFPYVSASSLSASSLSYLPFVRSLPSLTVLSASPFLLSYLSKLSHISPCLLRSTENKQPVNLENSFLPPLPSSNPSTTFLLIYDTPPKSSYYPWYGPYRYVNSTNAKHFLDHILAVIQEFNESEDPFTVVPILCSKIRIYQSRKTNRLFPSIHHSNDPIIVDYTNYIYNHISQVQMISDESVPETLPVCMTMHYPFNTTWEKYQHSSSVPSYFYDPTGDLHSYGLYDDYLLTPLTLRLSILSSLKNHYSRLKSPLFLDKYQL